MKVNNFNEVVSEVIEPTELVIPESQHFREDLF